MYLIVCVSHYTIFYKWVSTTEEGCGGHEPQNDNTLWHELSCSTARTIVL